MRFSLIALFCTLLSIPTFSQDKVLLMNGQEVECQIVSDTGYVVSYNVTRKNGKLKNRIAHRNEIFSYTRKDSTEKIIYVQDTMFGDIYNIPEMRAYLAGQHDARANFKAHHISAIGFGVCFTIAFLGKDGYITAVGPPVVYTLTQLIGKVKIREKTMTNKNYKYNDIYADGYEPPARTRKIVKAFGSGMIGSAAGVALYFILK